MGNSGRPFCVKGGEILGNVPTIDELSYSVDKLSEWAEIKYVYNYGWEILGIDHGAGCSMHAIFRIRVSGDYRLMIFSTSLGIEETPGVFWVGKYSIGGSVVHNNVYNQAELSLVHDVANKLDVSSPPEYVGDIKSCKMDEIVEVRWEKSWTITEVTVIKGITLKRILV